MPENIDHIAAIVRRKAMTVCCKAGYSFYLYNSGSSAPVRVSLSIYTTLDLLLLHGFLFVFIQFWISFCLAGLTHNQEGPSSATYEDDPS